MKTHSVIFNLTIILGLYGCATPATSTFDYRDKPPTKVENEIVVNRAFEKVWNGLVRQLAKGYFVVNNIEKESRLINVSFSTTSPEEYIDCGRTMRTFTRGKEEAEYDYEVAADSSYKYGAGKTTDGVFSLVGYVDRDTSLEGRINIYIAPNDQITEVTVNIRYILTLSTSGQLTYVNMYGKAAQSQALPHSSDTISFNTNQPNKSQEGISCFSKGLLEAEILEMAKADEANKPL